MNYPGTAPTIRTAVVEDLASIERLLSESALPREGLPPHLPNFLVAELNEAVIGAIGLEVYERKGLVRSLVVASRHQREGIGARLLATITDHARRRGVRDLYLLTTTAQEYFARKGFSVLERAAVQGAILTSSEFQGACPSTAICMIKGL